MDRRRVAEVTDAVAAGREVARADLAATVRHTLADLARRHPGHLVEVRVPPWGAVQVGVPGLAGVHRRGTPPNVVETDPVTWLLLAGGRLSWQDVVGAHRVSASGVHADLSAVFDDSPDRLVPRTPDSDPGSPTPAR